MALIPLLSGVQGRPLSILRGYVEAVPEEDTLGVEQPWTWKPRVTVSLEGLLGYCPGSGSEGGED
jgi:hypothetical protein